jgi:hypothetical protein
MPKSKHRRKPGGKAVTHPGRTPAARAHAQALDTRLWKMLGDMTEPPKQRNFRGLPLFDRDHDKPP